MLKWCPAGAFAKAVISMDDVEELCEVNSLCRRLWMKNGNIGNLSSRNLGSGKWIQMTLVPSIVYCKPEWMKFVLEGLMVHWTTRIIGRVSIVSNLFLQAAMTALPGHVPGLTALGTMVQRLQGLQWQSTWHVIFELKTVLDWRPNSDIFNMPSTCKVFESSGWQASEMVFRCSPSKHSWQLVSKFSEWPWTLQSKHIGSPVASKNHCMSKRKRRLQRITATMRTTTRSSHSHAPLEFISTYGTLPVMGFPLNHECGQGHQVPQGAISAIAKAFWILNICKCWDASIPLFFHLCQPCAIFQTIWHRWKNAPGNVLGNARDLAASSEKLSICSQVIIEMEIWTLSDISSNLSTYHHWVFGVYASSHKYISYIYICSDRPRIIQNNIPMAFTTTTTFSNENTNFIADINIDRNNLRESHWRSEVCATKIPDPQGKANWNRTVMAQHINTT